MVSVRSSLLLDSVGERCSSVVSLVVEVSSVVSGGLVLDGFSVVMSVVVEEAFVNGKVIVFF